MSGLGERQEGWLTADRLGRGLTIDPDTGLIEPKLAGALTFTPDGEIYFNTGPEITQAPASPIKASIPGLKRTSDVAVSAGNAAAAASRSAATAIAGLTTKQSTSQRGVASGYASLDSNGALPLTQAPFKAGTDTLRPADVRQVAAGFDMTSGSYSITFGRGTLGGGTPGHIYADPSEFDSTSFYVRSSEATDDGEFSWMVVKLT